MKTNFTFLLFPFISLLFGQEMQTPQPAFDFLLKYPSVRDFTMNESGTEAYFSIQNPLEELAVIVRISKINGQWSSPELVSFTGQYRDIEPSLSPDGLRLYFSSARPRDSKSTEPADYNIWYVERKKIAEPWSAPVCMEAPINSRENEFFPCIAKSGNFYFTSDREGTIGKDDIFVSPFDGIYAYASPLGETINSNGMEFNAYIDPDEKFILYTAYARAGGAGSGDLFISYKNEDGTWTEGKNLGRSINSRYMDYCPFVDKTSGTLYFTSRRSDVSKTHFTTLEEFDQLVHQYENGFSRLYKVSISDLLK